jgi:hypothetical protein
MMSQIDSWHRKISSGRHFQNGSIRDIIIYPHMKCRWNRTMLNLCGIVVAILKMATTRNFSMSGINSGHHKYVGRLWCPEMIPDIENFLSVDIFKMASQYRTNSTHNLPTYEMALNLCGIVATILKMATGRNCSMSGINSGHHYLPTYKILMIWDNVEFLPPIFMPCFGSHFEVIDICF